MRIEADNFDLFLTPVHKMDDGFLFHFVLRPKGGRPWWIGNIEAANWWTAEEIIFNAQKSGNLHCIAKIEFGV